MPRSSLESPGVPGGGRYRDLPKTAGDRRASKPEDAECGWRGRAHKDKPSRIFAVNNMDLIVGLGKHSGSSIKASRVSQFVTHTNR